MPRFFINKNSVEGEKILITNPSDINHIANVLRYKKKDRLILSCSDNFVYEAEIVSIIPDLIEAKIIEKYFSDKTLKINITLAQSIIKSQKQDFLIQKATELGVKTIIPFVSKNTVVKFDSEKDKSQKVQRWQKIVYESAKQCQRGDLAEIKPVSAFNEVLSLEGFDLKIVCSEKENALSIKQVLRRHSERPTGAWESQDFAINKIATSHPAGTPHNDGYGDILLVIGPEGGWDDSEIKAFSQKGFISATLGKLIYRAETAAIAAISHIVYEFEL